MSKFFQLVALSSMFLVGSASAATTVTIDDFGGTTNLNFPTLIVPGPPIVDPDASAIGGSRSLSVGGGATAGLVGVTGNGLELGLTNQTGMFTLSYGGIGAALFDCEFDGAFELELVGSDPAGLGVTLTVLVNGAAEATNVPLALGTNTINTGVLGGVASLDFIFDVPTSGDITVDSINYHCECPPEIPEPTTFAVWSVLGTVGMAASRRRRRNA